MLSDHYNGHLRGHPRPWPFQILAAVTADRPLRSRLFRVGVGLGAQLKPIAYLWTFQLKHKQEKSAFVCSQTTITAISVVSEPAVELPAQVGGFTGGFTGIPVYRRLERRCMGACWIFAFLILSFAFLRFSYTFLILFFSFLFFSFSSLFLYFSYTFLRFKIQRKGGEKEEKSEEKPEKSRSE